MFRNTYMEAYKSSYANDSTVQSLLCHFNHVYVTMGSILQDIEFQFSLMISQGTKETEVRKEKSRKSENERFSQKQMNERGQKSLQREKEMLSQFKSTTKSNKLEEKISQIEKNKPAIVQKHSNRADIGENRDSSYDDLFPVECRRSSQNNQPNKKTEAEVEVENLDELNDADFMDHLFRKRK